MEIFITTLNQIAFLFFLIALGFILGKFKFIPENSSTVLAKLENMVFVPALIMGTFIKNFTVEQIGAASKILLASLVLGLIMVPISIVISKCLTKSRYEQNIFTYGLVFSNFGFMGNAVVSSLFPDIFMEYIIFTLPLWIMIYVWGVPVLLIDEGGKKKSLAEIFKPFLNPMFVSMLVGIIIGLSGFGVPDWTMSVIDTAGSCMSPIAMLLTGITVSNINIKTTFTNIKVYAVSIIRLLVFPLLFIWASQFLNLDNTMFLCGLCSLAMPLGLNTIVVPSAYGRDTSVASAMAVISHILSCITIPIVFMLI